MKTIIPIATIINAISQVNRIFTIISEVIFVRISVKLERKMSSCNWNIRKLIDRINSSGIIVSSIFGATSREYV
jgi:hypothetical protein